MLLGARIASMAGGGPGPTPPTEYWGLHFVAEEAGAQIGMATVGSPDPVTLEYSTDDGATWATFTPGTTTVTLAAVGDTACFRAGAGGNTKIGKSDNNYRKFTLSKKCAAHGNIMSLLDGTDDATATAATMGDRCFRGLFRECANLTSAPDLPATTLATYCYDNMFRDCTALTTPMAELPALTVPQYAYRSMFYGCTALVVAPTISATNVAGSYGMTYMFFNCTALTSATIMCSSRNYNDYAFNEMFRYCGHLASIEIHVDVWSYSSGAFNLWVHDVAANGTFRCPAALGTDSTIARGTSRCPSGWTVVNI